MRTTKRFNSASMGWNYRPLRGDAPDGVVTVAGEQAGAVLAIPRFINVTRIDPMNPELRWPDAGDPATGQTQLDPERFPGVGIQPFSDLP